MNVIVKRQTVANVYDLRGIKALWRNMEMQYTVYRYVYFTAVTTRPTMDRCSRANALYIVRQKRGETRVTFALFRMQKFTFAVDWMRLRHCFNTNDSWLFEADDATHLYRSGHQLPMTARRRLHYPYREPIHLVAMSWSVLSFILSSLYTLSWNSIAIPPTSL